MDGGSHSRSAVALPPLSPLLSWKSMRGCDKAPPIQKKSRQAGFQDLTFWINNHSSIFKKETSGCAGEYWVQKRYLGKILLVKFSIHTKHCKILHVHYKFFIHTKNFSVRSLLQICWYHDEPKFTRKKFYPCAILISRFGGKQNGVDAKRTVGRFSVGIMGRYAWKWMAERERESCAKIISLAEQSRGPAEIGKVGGKNRAQTWGGPMHWVGKKIILSDWVICLG